jgi:hypothetical protein
VVWVAVTLKSYDFTSKEREFGRVVFAITLNRKRMTERIIIGRAEEVRRVLNGGDGEIFYDEARPLGSLLLTFESDTGGEWNTHLATLRESRPKKPLLNMSRWKNVAPVAEFLRAKYKSGEPSAMFAAIRTWEDYLNFYPQKGGHDLLNDRLFMLYKPFTVYGEYKPWEKEAAAALSVAVRDGDSAVELWYPVAKRPFETIVATSSFLPVIFYYQHKIEEWGYVFQECKVCGKYFLARSRHYELCSDDCRKLKAVEAQQEYDERTKSSELGSSLEQLHNNAYHYWNNRLRKLKKADKPKGAAAFKSAFDVYRQEVKKRKAAVKRREISLADFSSWVAQQQNEADRLIEGLAKTQ